MLKYVIMTLGVAIACILFMSPAVAQESIEPFGYIYEEAASATGDTIVIRSRYPLTELKQKEEEKIAEIMAEVGQYTPPGQQQYSDPRAVAEWQFYWEQLKLWERYIQKRLFRGQNLKASVKDMNFVDPSTIDSQLQDLYNVHVEQSQKVMYTYYNRYLSLLSRIEDRIWGREVYRSWVERNTQKLHEFASEWLRRFTGEEIEVEGKVFLVSPQPLKNVPPGKVNIVTTNLTPYDLLNEDGTIKQSSDVVQQEQ